jgi:hypothetical protein
MDSKRILKNIGIDTIIFYSERAFWNGFTHAISGLVTKVMAVFTKHCVVGQIAKKVNYKHSLESTKRSPKRPPERLT